MDEVALLAERPKELFFCHPKRTPFRLLMLLVISLICFGSYFSVDEIQNLGPLWTNTASKYVRPSPKSSINCSEIHAGNFHTFPGLLTTPAFVKPRERWNTLLYSTWESI